MKIQIKKDKNSRKVFYFLLAVLVVVIVFFTFKFAQKYKENSEFDFDSISPQGYFNNLQTSIPESPTS